MSYVISEDGKYCYKVSKDGKKSRISKEEYLKKTKTATKDSKKDMKKVSKKDSKKVIKKDSKKIMKKDSKKIAKKIMKKKLMKGGAINYEEISWIVIIGKTGNLSPVLQTYLTSLGFVEEGRETVVSNNYVLLNSKFVVFGSEDFHLKDITNISAFQEILFNICNANENDGEYKRKGAIIFASGDEDMQVFESCKNEEMFKRYKQEPNNTISLKVAQEKLWNSNFKAPIELFSKIKDFDNIAFVYISSIYVFAGISTPDILKRPEVIFDENVDFINVGENNTAIDELFKKEGSNIFAYGKRFVELQLNSLLLSSGDEASQSTSSASQSSSQSGGGGLAKVIILRMDAITDETTTSADSSTFLKSLSTYNPSTNLVMLDQEVRYPVTAKQVATVLVGAITAHQDDNIKVYHIAGTEKEKGLTKADIIEGILNVKKQQKLDRKMDDSNSLEVAPKYIEDESAINILGEIFNKIKLNENSRHQQVPLQNAPQEPQEEPVPAQKISGGKAFSKVIAQITNKKSASNKRR